MARCASLSVWGTDVYTSDSAVCTAAVHAGAISTAQGGAFHVDVLPGRPAYAPSVRNGVASQGWAQWDRSFAVVPLGDGPIVTTPPNPAANAIACDAAASTLAGPTGARHVVVCPGGCGQATIWGTDVYTDDSSICVAAIHVGAIPAAIGGPVAVTILDGMPSYVGLKRNGVSSSPYGVWQRSFRVDPP
jgi:hypothetical protein